MLLKFEIIWMKIGQVIELQNDSYLLNFAELWHKVKCIGHLVRLKLTSNGLIV